MLLASPQPLYFIPSILYGSQSLLSFNSFWIIGCIHHIMGKHRKAHHHKSPLVDPSAKLTNHQWPQNSHGNNRPRAKSHSYQPPQSNATRIPTHPHSYSHHNKSTHHNHSKPKPHRPHLQPAFTTTSTTPPHHPHSNPTAISKTPCALRTDYHHMKHHSTIRAILAEGSLLESKLRLFLDGLAGFLKMDPEAEEMDWEVCGRVEVVVLDRERERDREGGKEGKGKME